MLLVLLAATPCGALTDDGGLHRLLVQRSIQTVCYISRECRDPPTAQWLAARSRVPERYHGIDGFESDWRVWILQTLAAPTETVEVASVLKKHRGVSPSNPYLQPETMTYSFEVHPADVAERILQTARDIAAEWDEDLRLIGGAEADAVWRVRRARVTNDDEELRETLPPFAQRDTLQDGGASPYRRGNYELLQICATREAVRCTLAELAGASSPSRRLSHELLTSVYDARSTFLGEQPAHAAEAWLGALLEQPVALRMPASGEGEPALIDPRSLVEGILAWRKVVADDWLERLSAFDDAVLDLKRAHLARAADLS